MIEKYKHINYRNIFLYISILLSFPTGSGLAAGRDRVTLPDASTPTVECIMGAAAASDLPLAVLFGVLATEGGTPGEALRNDNGTWDMGPFQINTCHVNELVAMGIDPATLLRDGCVGAYAAAWLLRKEYNRTGNLWEAVGSYHSRNPERRDAYIARVKSNLSRLQREGVVSLLSRGEP